MLSSHNSSAVFANDFERKTNKQTTFKPIIAGSIMQNTKNNKSLNSTPHTKQEERKIVVLSNW